MIKAWPIEIKERVWNTLRRQWEDKTIPAHWKWRWMCLKPKTESSIPTADDLRPLCLVDTLRKLWERIILNRIQQVWQAHHTLATGQHCIQGRGCATALLQFQAAQEMAQRNQQDLYMSSWDIRKAFDSISKNILVIAWCLRGMVALRGLYILYYMFNSV